MQYINDYVDEFRQEHATAKTHTKQYNYVMKNPPAEKNN